MRSFSLLAAVAATAVGCSQPNVPATDVVAEMDDWHPITSADCLYHGNPIVVSDADPHIVLNGRRVFVDLGGKSSVTGFRTVDKLQDGKEYEGFEIVESDPQLLTAAPSPGTAGDIRPIPNPYRVVRTIR